MARITAAALRSCARDAMLACGGRGFMRFLPDGPYLLVTDAIRRCADEAQRRRLIAALEAAGFDALAQDGLLLLAPTDAVLARIEDARLETDWESPLHPAQALAVRWMKKERRPLGGAGRQMIIETLRLTWQQPEKVLAGLDALRAYAALQQRSAEESGLHEAGALLGHWCLEQKGSDADEA